MCVLLHQYVAGPERPLDLARTWLLICGSAVLPLPGQPHCITLNSSTASDRLQLFGFDAGLDDFGFALDNAAPDILADCLVPDADAAEAPDLNTVDIAAELPFDVEPVAVAPAAASKRSSAVSVPFPGDEMQAGTPTSCVPASSAGEVPWFDNFLPMSLIPMDAERFSALQERRMKVFRFWEKKKTRQFKKTIRYASRKRYAEVRPRIKGRFARKDEILAAQAAGVPLM